MNASSVCTPTEAWQTDYTDCGRASGRFRLRTTRYVRTPGETHLPVIVDPSHAGGKAWMVPALARAAVAAGADGLLVEMHPKPCEAWCDAD